MSAAALFSMFLVGLLGSTHCLGMCGGIVSALTVRLPGDRPRQMLQLAYHAGRLATYTAAGALAAGLGSAAASEKLADMAMTRENQVTNGDSAPVPCADAE